MDENNGQAGVAQQSKEKEVCGIIMPIADTDGYPLGHWQEVKAVLNEAIVSSGYIPNIVSYSNDTGVIHNRIIGNLFNNPIVVCDVSSRNSNVMFELGMRLAFDKAVVVVTDDRTKFSFDTQVVEHLIYPSDLNYLKIVDFKELLKNKIASTVLAYSKPDNPTFLKSFVQYKAQLKEETVGASELILKRIEQLDTKINNLASVDKVSGLYNTSTLSSNYDGEVEFLIINSFYPFVETLRPDVIKRLSKQQFIKFFLDYLIEKHPSINFQRNFDFINSYSERFLGIKEKI